MCNNNNFSLKNSLASSFVFVFKLNPIISEHQFFVFLDTIINHMYFQHEIESRQIQRRDIESQNS